MTISTAGIDPRRSQPADATSAAISSPPALKGAGGFFRARTMNTLKRQPKARCLRHYLRGIPSQAARRNIRRLYIHRISAAGLETGGMNRAKREILERCIFQVVDDFESQAGG